MKNIVTSFILSGFILTSCSVAQTTNNSSSTTTQTKTYEVINDPESKILKGYIDRSDLETDTSFKWFKENTRWGNAPAPAIEALQKNGKNVHFIVFGGTWCHDTQNNLPVFYRLLDKSGIANDKVTLIGVDRAKTAMNEFHKAFNITLVPTFIVMQDGKEIGRVVENGKYGAIDKEIGEIVATASSK